MIKINKIKKHETFVYVSLIIYDSSMRIFKTEKDYYCILSELKSGSGNGIKNNNDYYSTIITFY